MPCRVYLTGHVCAERNGAVLMEGEFPSRQSRLLFSYLVCQESQYVTMEQLAEILWPGPVPPAWDSALKSLISRLRRVLAGLGLSVSSEFGCYQLQLPPDVWVDIEAARNSVDEAEGAMRSQNLGSAWGATNVALTITQRPFLPGDDGGWVDQKRRELRGFLIRAMDCYMSICLRTDQASLAVQMANQAVTIEPFRETSYQCLMEAHAALGNRAEALRIYQCCRELLAEELGIDPSPETENVYMSLLAR